MLKIFAETDRLILREIVEQDAERLFLLDKNPEVMRYIGVKPLTKIEETHGVIKKIRAQYEHYNIGRWAVIEKESGLLIGWCGLKFLTEEINGYKNVHDLGYRFLPEFWSRGYATESAKAALEFGFNEMKLPVIYAYADILNTASNHTLEKLNFTKLGTFIDEADGATCFWYELRAVANNHQPSTNN